MTVLADLAAVLCVTCAVASPTSRRTFARWTGGVYKRLLPRGVLMGCGWWLLLLFFASLVIGWGWAALLAVSPVLAAVDVTGWWRRRRTP